jgi:hypothetical protein
LVVVVAIWCWRLKCSKLFAVFVVGIHGAGHGLVLVQDGQVQLIGPPIGIRAGAVLGARANGGSGGVKWALGCGGCRHVVLLLRKFIQSENQAMRLTRPNQHDVGLYAKVSLHTDWF